MSTQAELFTPPPPEEIAHTSTHDYACRAVREALWHEEDLEGYMHERSDARLRWETLVCAQSAPAFWAESACWMIAWAMEETR